ncbi:hypothetical protein BQ8794_140397 [Mesorhizobium prunaredense]|uniref:Uncharacterized protein n=1 Tax=Mesorhizobium prunaredense TaxID=1631249 RepID=A0A1R3V2X7_9HYPH|nr:hypothetical protein BQ8794_140397 [Mesorhizobium prunaredense]
MKRSRHEVKPATVCVAATTIWRDVNRLHLALFRYFMYYVYSLGPDALRMVSSENRLG